MTKHEHLSEWRANLYLAGELEEAERLEVEAHLEECEQCRQYVERLRAFDAALVSSSMPGWLERMPESEAASQASLPHRPANRRVRGAAVGRWMSAAAAIAAVVLAVWWFRPAPGTPGATEEQGPDVVRVKSGGKLGFKVYVQKPDGAQLVSPQDEVHPGDKIGFRVLAEESQHIMIVGRDERGSGYLCYPQSGRSAQIQTPGQWETLGQAMELDNVLGSEHIVALMCPEAFEFSQIQPPLEGASVRSDLQGRLDTLREGCTQREITLRKTAPK